ncbi:MAG TPA: hypothetical protein VFM88_09070 [Vicinamibacteria bacterium]|nr:hypothetical protein [Vicinamibacteria bacterium]
MRSRCAAATLLVALAVSVSAEDVIERVLADLGGEPILLSEVRLFERLKRLGRGAALEALLDERLMYQEAARLPQAVLTRDEATAACADLAAKAPELASDPALCALARREAVVLKYISFRFAADEGEEGQTLNERIEEWVRDLRAAATIRYNAGP